MNTRQEWLNNTDYTSQFYSAEETINEVKENFDIRRYYSAEGADVIVDGINCRALVQYFTNPLNQAKYDRKLHVTMDININTGSIVDYDGYKWLVIGSIDDIQAYKTAGMVKCNNTLNLYINSILHQIPCIVSNNIDLGTDENNYISVPDSTIILKIPNNEITRQIKHGEIYELGLQNYELKDINDIVESGILKMEIEYSQEMQEEHVYTISILNGDNIQIAQSQLLTINAELRDNGAIVPLPTLLKSSSDEIIATINENGIVTVNSVGSVIFTISMSNDITIKDTINVEIVEDEQHNYTYTLTSISLPDNEIIITQTKLYTIQKYNNGVLVEQDFTFSVIGDVSSYQLIAVDGGNCSIRALKSGYVIELRGVDDSDVSKVISKEIRLKNLF